MRLCKLCSSSVPRYPWLITWILWHHLFHPPVHPLFRRAQSASIDSRMTRFITGVALLAGGVILALFIPLNPALPMLLPVVLVTLSSCYVIRWVVRISATIAREYERDTYDLLCVLPPGAVGATWALCVASLHRDDTLGWIDLLRRLFSGLLLLILLVVLLTTALRGSAPDTCQFWQLFLEIMLLAGVAYVEHVQAIVQGSLVGMLMPARHRTPADACIRGAVVFLTMQVISLMVALLAGPVLFSSRDIEAGSILLSLPVFYLIREVFIMTLWGMLAHRLNASPAEFRFGV